LGIGMTKEKIMEVPKLVDLPSKLTKICLGAGHVVALS